jgi:hypothetical protein
MKRLRHPIRAVREPFGTAGLIVACVALVLALTGAAFAAGGLTGKQKKEVEKIAKKVAGKPGAAGAPGAQGPAGPAGKDGANGAAGAKGATGPQGSVGSKGATGPAGGAGAAGKSVQVVEEIAPGEEGCEENGGIAYEVEGAPSSFTEICNGRQGQDGEPGSPWGIGTLPPGATETGTWATMKNILAEPVAEAPAAISFPVPLAVGIESNHVHVSTQENFGTFCTGGIDGGVGPGVPSPGELCIYVGAQEAASSPEVWQASTSNEGASKPGAILYWHLGTGGYATGSYAVTGCSEEPSSPSPCP